MMSTFADIFRPYWLPGLNNISGRQIKELAGWICDEDYQIYLPVTTSSFTLNIYESEPMLFAYAAEVSRISVAAFETLEVISSAKASKSIAWSSIQLYYSAFFAAHALLRIFGHGCNSLGRSQWTSVLKVASAWGATKPTSMTGGLYQFSFDSTLMEFSAQTLNSSPHEGFWRMFDDRIKQIIENILGTQTTTTVDLRSQQAAAIKLGQLRDNLSFLGNRSQPTWLTQMRNSINYDHKWAAWWPYPDRPKYYDRIQASADDWKKDAMDIELFEYPDEELLRFQATCNFILSVCRESLTDLSNRCPTGKSFLKFGSVAYLDYSKMLLNQSPA
jgi:hypothetical protein